MLNVGTWHIMSASGTVHDAKFESSYLNCKTRIYWIWNEHVASIQCLYSRVRKWVCSPVFLRISLREKRENLFHTLKLALEWLSMGASTWVIAAMCVGEASIAEKENYNSFQQVVQNRHHNQRLYKQSRPSCNVCGGRSSACCFTLLVSIYPFPNICFIVVCLNFALLS